MTLKIAPAAPTSKTQPQVAANPKEAKGSVKAAPDSLRLSSGSSAKIAANNDASGLAILFGVPVGVIGFAAGVSFWLTSQ